MNQAVLASLNPAQVEVELRRADELEVRRGLNDDVFLKLKKLLEPFGITTYDTEGWGAYERRIEVEQH